MTHEPWDPSIEVTSPDSPQKVYLSANSVFRAIDGQTGAPLDLVLSLKNGALITKPTRTTNQRTAP